MNAKKLAALAFALLCLIAAQPTGLVLHLSRDFGYAGFGNDIEGLFTLSVEELENLSRVDFYIDDQMMATVDQAPFRYQFSTKSYAPGEHRLYVIGTTADGRELRSNEIVRAFLSPEESRSKIVGLVIPLLAIGAAFALLSAVLPSFLGRGKLQIGKYGISGGTVCPRCGLPFPLHLLSVRVVIKKLERCPHCGKWVWVRRASLEDLAAAEARWRGEEGMGNLEKKEDRLRRQIDDSRYDK